MWSGKTLQQRWSMDLSEAVEAIAWCGGSIVAMPIEGSLAIARADGSNPVGLDGHAGGNLGLAISVDGCRIATVGQDGMLRTAAQDGSGVTTHRAGDGWIDQVAWSPRGEIATSCRRSVTLWPEDLQSSQRLDDFPSGVADLAYAPDGATLAISHYGGVTLLDGVGERRHMEWKGSQLQLRWNHDGRWLAAATQDRALHLWRIPVGEQCEISGFPGKVKAIAWHRRKPLVACAGGPGVPVWNCGGAGPEGRRPQEFAWHRSDVTALAWHPRQTCLASADRDGWVAVWSPGDTGPSTCFQAPAGITCLAWDAAGDHLGMGCSDGTLITCTH